MIITKEKFYLEELNTEIPEIAAAVELYRDGKEADADHAFAEYLRASLNPEHYFLLAPGEIKEGNTSTLDGNYTVIENADRICQGIVRSCSFTYDYEGEIDWNKNGAPDSYREWLWQLNRHHIFKIIAYAYRKTGDEKYAEAFQRHMLGWIAQAECPQWPVPNRSAKVPTWRTISAGIRMGGNWPYAIHAFIGSKTIKDETWVKIAMSQWEHGQLLSNSPSSLNWLDIEMSGLNALGTIFRYFKKSEDWRLFAVNTLASELETQVYDDGFQCELTTGYQGVVISTNMGCWTTANHYGLSIPDNFKASIRKLYTMYPKLMRPDGKTPCTNDGGCREIKSVISGALKNFPDDEEFQKIVDGRIDEVYPLDVVLEYSGMITMRTGWGEKDIWMFFESAPFGAGHQHDDKLNLDLYAYGKNLLDVVGNFAYDGSDMRKYCVRSRGHNTGIVDGKGQNARPTHTPWTAEKVKIKSDLEVNIRPDTVVAYGKYNRGYGGALTPVTHERKIVFFRTGLEGTKPFFVVLDDFTSGDGEQHKCEASYQLFDMPLTLRGRHATVDAGDGVTLEVVTHAALATTTGTVAPEYMGYRPSKGERIVKEHIPAPVLSIYGYGECVHLATILYPTPDGVAPELGVTCDDVSFTLTVDGKEYKFMRDEDFLTTKPV